MMSPSWAALIDFARIPGERAAIVLLSGGMDSTACLHLALERHALASIAAISVDYGQPHRDRELTYAQRLARTLGVRWESLCVASALHVTRPAERMANAPHGAPGPHAATIPLRNLFLQTLAAMHGRVWFPSLPLDVYIGACADDAARFADCHPDAIAQSTVALTYNTAASVRVVAPLVRTTKRALVEALKARPEALDAVRRSWSCYRGGDVPCGECTPCALRTEAFAFAGVDDAPISIAMCGGDLQRERR